jgi:5-bromo-4-chloroindolyl phosphate hydrolysis protein
MANAKPYSPELHKVRYKIKGIMLFIAPFPIFLACLFDLLGGRISEAFINAAAFSGFMFSAFVAREGFRQEGEYHRRSFSRAPRVPLKAFAALLLGATVGFTAWLALPYYDLGESLLFAITASIGFVLYYGLDPRKDKLDQLDFGVSAEEVMETLSSAEQRIQQLDQARKKIPDLHIKQRLQHISQQAREIIQNIEDDPSNLDRSRRFLTVYLNGAKRVTESYVKTLRQPNHVANTAQTQETVYQQTDFNQVLDAIEQTITQQQQKLLKDDQFDLDVQIQVLETQLQQEGIRKS